MTDPKKQGTMSTGDLRCNGIITIGKRLYNIYFLSYQGDRRGSRKHNKNII